MTYNVFGGTLNPTPLLHNVMSGYSASKPHDESEHRLATEGDYVSKNDFNARIAEMSYDVT